MKQNLIFIGIVSAVLVSCNKEKIDAPTPVVPTRVISLEKDVSYPNQNFLTPKATGKVGQYIFHAKNVPSKFKLQYADIGGIGNGGSNFRLAVKGFTDTFHLIDDIDYGTYFAVEAEIPDGDYTLQIFADGAPGDDSLQTGMSIEYYAPDSGTNNTDFVWGQKITFTYKTSLTLKKENVSTAVIKNGELTDGYSVIATGKGAVKQFSYAVTFADNDTLSTLSWDSLRFYVDDIDATSEVSFYNNAGIKIVSLGEATTKVSVVFTTESRINGFENYTIAGTFKGFGKGDGFTIVPLNDDTVPQNGFSYLNKGTTGGNLKLYSSPNASSGAQAYNFIYSDLSAADHAYILGISSSDWFNGYKVFPPLVKNIFQF